MLNKIHLNFSYPYADFLMLYGVPSEKWKDFYNEFGKYMFSLSTSDEEKSRALQWMRNNGDINKIYNISDITRNQ